MKGLKALKFVGITAIAISVILPTLVLVFFSALGANSIMMVATHPAVVNGNEDVFYNLTQAFLILIINISVFWIIALTACIWLAMTVSIFSDDIVGFFRWASAFRITHIKDRDL